MGFLANACRREIDAGELLSMAAGRAGFGGGMLLGGAGRGPRNVAELLKVFGSSAWPRLALDVTSNRQADASWHLYAPARGRPRRRSLSLKAAVLAESAEERQKAIPDLKQSGEVRELEDHPLLRMLRGGVPGVEGLGGAEVSKLHAVYIDLVGEAIYVLIRQRTSLIPVQAWPVSPAWATPPKSGSKNWTIRLRGGFSREVPESDIAWAKIADPSNPFGRGTGIFEALDDELDTYEQAVAYLAALFRNRGRPDLLLVTPGANSDSVNEMEQAWMRKLGGAMKAGAPHFIAPPLQGAAGFTVHDLGKSAADLQTVELSRFERDVILQVAHVPPNVIGATESSNRATAYMAEKSLRRNSTIPGLEHRRGFIQRRFLDPRPDGPAEFLGEDRLIVDYKLPPLVDEDLRLDSFKAAPWAPTINDWLEMQGLERDPALEGKRLVPLASQIVDLKGITSGAATAGFRMRALDAAFDEVIAGGPFSAAAERCRLNDGERALLAGVLGRMGFGP